MRQARAPKSLPGGCLLVADGIGSEFEALLCQRFSRRLFERRQPLADEKPTLTLALFTGCTKRCSHAGDGRLLCHFVTEIPTCLRDVQDTAERGTVSSSATTCLSSQSHPLHSGFPCENWGSTAE